MVLPVWSVHLALKAMEILGVFILDLTVLCSNQDGKRISVFGVAGKCLADSVPHISILENGFGLLKTIPP